MQKRTIKTIFILISSAACIAAGISGASGASAPDTTPDMKYAVGIKDGSTIACYAPVGIGIRGDADSNGKLTAGDAAYIASYRANSSLNSNYMPDFENSLGGAMADTDANGKITARDASLIAKYLAKKSFDPGLTWEEVIN